MAETTEKVNRIPKFFADLSKYDKSLTAFDRTYLTRYSVSKAGITRAIENKDVATLRGYSQYFFHASGEYRRLVEYFAKLLTFAHVVVPVTTDSTANAPRFEKGFQKIQDYVKQAHIEESGRIIAHTVIKDGAFYGYERELKGDFILQQLPTNYCRSRFKIDGNYAIEYDFSFFDLFRTEEDKKEVFNSFPDEFEKMYRAYQGDTQLYRWQLLEPMYARAHMLTDEVPFLSASFLDLLELEDYKILDKKRVEGQVDHIVVQEIPVDAEGQLTMEMEEITTIHQNAKGMLAGSNKRVITTPAKTTSLDFKQNTAASQDDVEKAMRTVYSSAGTPMILFSSGLKGNSIGLERAIEADEALMFELLDQFERWYETRFKSIVPFNKNFSFEIVFPPITIFNRKKMWEQYRDAATLGFPTKLLAMATLGIGQSQMSSLLFYENEILELPERMIPLSTSYTQTGEEAEGGRPESTEPLSDEGQKTKDQEKNKNRADKGGK